jgi:hypothetical protein
LGKGGGGGGWGCGLILRGGDGGPQEFSVDELWRKQEEGDTNMDANFAMGRGGERKVHIAKEKTRQRRSLCHRCCSSPGGEEGDANRTSKYVESQ